MLNMDLSGQVAMVTGASRGIGQAIAQTLARQGATVLLAARSVAELADVARGIEAAGGRAESVRLDVAEEADIVDALSFCKERYGRLDILVNCAGIGVFGPVVETRTEDWDRIMAVNARGAFLMCREAVPLMANRSAAGRDATGSSACIINIASVVGVKGYINQGAYTASKHALVGLTKVLAQEVQPLGIRVHVVCPGGVDTALVGDARPDLDRSVLMRPEEIADLVLFLVAQQGNAIVDQVNVRRSVSSPWFD